MTPEQQATFNSQEAALKSWWDYWSTANPPLADPNAWAQRIAHIYADPLNPTNLGVTFEFPGEDGLYYALPWANGAPRTTAETKYDANGGVLQNTDPLRLNATGTLEDGTKYQLVWYGGRWVRADSAGIIREVIDNKAAFQKYDGVISGVYTFNDFENRQVTFNELPLINKATLDADDLSDVQVDSNVMEKAIAVTVWLNHIDAIHSSVTIERYDPNFTSFADKPETRPFKVIRAFRTNINGKDFPGMIILVKNSDKSTTKLKVLLPNFFAQRGNEKYLNEQLKNGPATNWGILSMVSGSFVVTEPLEDNGPDVKYTLGEFYSTPEEEASIQEFMLRWKKTGVTPAELGKFNLLADPGLW